MNIKKSPLMAGLLTLNALFGVMTSKAYDGKIEVKEGCFDAPIDKVLGISNDFVMTYRSQAKYTSLTNVQEIASYDKNHNPVYEAVERVVTNSVPFVRVSLDGKTGFASGTGVGNIDGEGVVNPDTGATVFGSNTTTNETVVLMGSNGLSNNIQSYKLRSASGQDGNTLIDLTEPKYYFDSENKTLLAFSRRDSNAAGCVTRFQQDEYGDFIKQQQYRFDESPYQVKMGAQSTTHIYVSDGFGIRAFVRGSDSVDVNGTNLVVNAQVKGMAVAGDQLFWTSGWELYGQKMSGGMSFSYNITDLASDGETLYIGNTNGLNHTTNHGGVPAKYVGDAVRIIKGSDSQMYKIMSNGKVNVIE